MIGGEVTRRVMRATPAHCPYCGMLGEVTPGTNGKAVMCWDCRVGWRTEKQKKKKRVNEYWAVP